MRANHLFPRQSSLRNAQQPPSGPSTEVQDLHAYLNARYCPDASSSAKKRKKKKKKETQSTNNTLKIVDEDLTGFAPIEEMPTVEAVDPDAPAIVDEDEVAAAEHYQLKKKKKTYYGEGGWTQVEENTEEEDLSPPRDHHPPLEITPDGDLSPPRRNQGRTVGDDDGDLSPPRQTPAEMSEEKSERKHMLDGTRTGMMTGVEMRNETRKKRKEDENRMARLLDEVTGRGAETVYRNREGQRITLEDLQKQEAKEKRKITWEKVEWDSGLVQQGEMKRQKAELAREASKPFARNRDDADLDAMYRSRTRWGDPMIHLSKKQRTRNKRQKHEMTPVIDETNRQWFEKSGFVVPQDVPEHSWIRRGVAPLTNRYNIRPGRHWDGVDRSNGFEKDYAKYMNEQAAKEREGAMWTMEDM